MPQKVFYSELNQFCVDWATRVPGSVTLYGGPLRTGAPGFSTQLRTYQEALFERLLLFDAVDLNVDGAECHSPAAIQ